MSVAEYVRSLGNSLNRSRVLGLGEMGSLSTKASTPDVTTRYAFEREIGRGHIGVVRLCRDLVTEKEYACKTILKSSIQVPYRAPAPSNSPISAGHSLTGPISLAACHMVGTRCWPLGVSL